MAPPQPCSRGRTACSASDGRKFRQEWYQGHAEDVFKVIDLSAPVTVPFGSFRHALRTAETTALEPDVLDNKYLVGASVRSPRWRSRAHGRNSSSSRSFPDPNRCQCVAASPRSRRCGDQTRGDG
jgi:hypothetical protein